MGANSIRINLAKENTLSEIRLFQSADFDHKFTHIIVEGINDIRFFQNRVSNRVVLYESFSGKEGVLEIVNSFSKVNVIGICDRDYDVAPPSPNIFFYDYSSLETMMLSSFSTFKAMCNTLYPHISDVRSIYDQTFQQIRWISAFRKISYQQNLCIKFTAFSPFKVFNKSDKTLDVSKTITLLRKANRDVFLSNPNIIRLVSAEVKAFTDISVDLSTANGHDALAMFHCLCKTPKVADFSEAIILITLILIYNFQESELHTTLNQYASIHGLQIVS